MNWIRSLRIGKAHHSTQDPLRIVQEPYRDLLKACTNLSTLMIIEPPTMYQQMSINNMNEREKAEWMQYNATVCDWDFIVKKCVEAGKLQSLIMDFTTLSQPDAEVSNQYHCWNIEGVVVYRWGLQCGKCFQDR
jgi:hypothetical protein